MATGTVPPAPVTAPQRASGPGAPAAASSLPAGGASAGRHDAPSRGLRSLSAPLPGAAGNGAPTPSAPTSPRLPAGPGGGANGGSGPGSGAGGSSAGAARKAASPLP